MTEGLYESFAIPGTDVVVPNGTYAGWESQIVFFTDQSRPVALNTRFNWGAFLSGSKRTTTADLTLRRGARTSAGLRVSYNDVMLPQGDFTATLAGVNLGYFFTPRIYVSTPTRSTPGPPTSASAGSTPPARASSSCTTRYRGSRR